MKLSIKIGCGALKGCIHSALRLVHCSAGNSNIVVNDLWKTAHTRAILKEWRVVQAVTTQCKSTHFKGRSFRVTISNFGVSCRNLAF